MNVRALSRLGAVSRDAKFDQPSRHWPCSSCTSRGVVADVGVARRKRERAGKIGERRFEPSEPVEQISAIGEGEHEIRIACDRRVEIGDCLLVPIVDHQRRAARIERRRMVRPQRDRPAEAFDRMAAARERRKDVSAVDPGFDEIRLRGDRAIELVERQVGAAELLLRDADQVVCGGEFRFRLDCPAGEFDPLAEAALLAVDRRKPEQRGAVSLFERQHLRVALRCARQVAPPVQQRGLMHQERGGRLHGGTLPPFRLDLNRCGVANAASLSVAHVGTLRHIGKRNGDAAMDANSQIGFALNHIANFSAAMVQMNIHRFRDEILAQPRYADPNGCCATASRSTRSMTKTESSRRFSAASGRRPAPSSSLASRPASSAIARSS